MRPCDTPPQPTGSPSVMMMYKPGVPEHRVREAGTEVPRGPLQTQQWGQKSDLALSRPEAASKRFSIASIHP